MSKENIEILPDSLVRLQEIRIKNLRALIENVGSATAFAKSIGLKNSSFLSHLAGPNPSRSFSEKVARKLEVDLNMPENWFDHDRCDFAKEVHVSPELKKNKNIKTIDQSRLEKCIGIILLKRAELDSKKLAKLITNLYESNPEIDPEDTILDFWIDTHE